MTSPVCRRTAAPLRAGLPAPRGENGNKIKWRGGNRQKAAAFRLGFYFFFFNFLIIFIFSPPFAARSPPAAGRQRRGGGCRSPPGSVRFVLGTMSCRPRGEPRPPPPLPGSPRPPVPCPGRARPRAAGRAPGGQSCRRPPRLPPSQLGGRSSPSSLAPVWDDN